MKVKLILVGKITVERKTWLKTWMMTELKMTICDQAQYTIM